MTDENVDDTGDEPDDGDTSSTSVEGEVAAAVDEALEPELKRARARFIQAIVGLDRGEGVGRGGEPWDEDSYRRLGLEPDDPAE